MDQKIFQPQAPVNKNAIPVRWGIIIGLVSVVASLVLYRFLISNYYAFLAGGVVIFILSIVLYFVTGLQQRKAFGGYISFKEAFRAIFIALLISTLISAVWGVIYAEWIDPHVTEKLKAATLSFMESMKLPQDEMDKASDQFDREMGQGFQFKNFALGLAKGIVVSSIFAMICAVIIKREPKGQML